MNKILVIESEPLLLRLLEDRKEPNIRTIPFVLVTGLEFIEIPHYRFKPNRIIT